MIKRFRSEGNLTEVQICKRPRANSLPNDTSLIAKIGAVADQEMGTEKIEQIIDENTGKNIADFTEEIMHDEVVQEQQIVAEITVNKPKAISAENIDENANESMVPEQRIVMEEIIADIDNNKGECLLQQQQFVKNVNHFYMNMKDKADELKKDIAEMQYKFFSLNNISENSSADAELKQIDTNNTSTDDEDTDETEEKMNITENNEETVAENVKTEILENKEKQLKTDTSTAAIHETVLNDKPTANLSEEVAKNVLIDELDMPNSSGVLEIKVAGKIWYHHFDPIVRAVYMSREKDPRRAHGRGSKFYLCAEDAYEPCFPYNLQKFFEAGANEMSTFEDQLETNERTSSL